MAAETYTFTPKKLFAGAEPDVVTQSGTYAAANTTTTEYTLVESNAAGEWIAHAGVNKVAGITINHTGVSQAGKAGQAYIAGCFWADQITWPGTATTNLLKKKLLEGTQIVVVFQDVGEV
jgi:hypothetical protein